MTFNKTIPVTSTATKIATLLIALGIPTYALVAAAAQLIAHDDNTATCYFGDAALTGKDDCGGSVAVNGATPIPGGGQGNDIPFDCIYVIAASAQKLQLSWNVR